MSNKKEREKRREEREAAEAQASTVDRRSRLLQVGAAAVFAVIIAVVVLIVVNGSSSSSSGGDASNVTEAAQVDKLLAGIPQEGLVLGDPKAPVELAEYGDLQCPICKEYSEEFLPTMIDKYVKDGKMKVSFNNFVIISEESEPAGAAAIAAGEQGRGWNYIELWYRNQGEERSGYVTDDFMESIAKGASVKNLAEWNKKREEPATLEAVNKSTERANTYGFTGTPSFAIKGPSSNGTELLGTPETMGEFEEAIEKAS